MTRSSETKTIAVPLHVWGRLASEADNRGVTIADLLVVAVQQIIRPPEGRADMVVALARAGFNDREISDRLGEQRSYVAEQRRKAGIEAIRDRGRGPTTERKTTTMTQQTVRVYTKPDCKQCDLTKAELTKRGVPFEVEDLLEPGNLAAAKALGFASAPVVIIGADGWAGFRPDKIAELAARIGERS